MGACLNHILITYTVPHRHGYPEVNPEAFKLQAISGHVPQTDLRMCHLMTCVKDDNPWGAFLSPPVCVLFGSGWWSIFLPLRRCAPLCPPPVSRVPGGGGWGGLEGRGCRLLPFCTLGGYGGGEILTHGIYGQTRHTKGNHPSLVRVVVHSRLIESVGPFGPRQTQSSHPSN